MNKILKDRTLQILVSFMVLLLPLSANLIEHAGSALILILSLLGATLWLTRQDSVEFNREEKWIMFSFAGYITICILFFLGHSIAGNVPWKWKLDKELRLLAFIPIYYLFVQARLKSGALWFGVAVSAILSAIYAIYDIYVLHSFRANGPYYPIAFGDISLMFGFMSLTGITYFRRKHPLMIIVPLLAFLCGLVTAFLSATRGSLVAVPALAAVVLIQMGQFPRARMLRVIFVLGLCALISGAYMLPGSLMDIRIKVGLREIGAFFQHSDKQKDVRLRMWAESIKLIREHPFVGIGHGSYRPAIKKKAENDPSLADIQNFSSPHNMFLANMVNYGWPGLFILLAIFLSPLLLLIPAIQKVSPPRQLGYAGLVLILSFVHFALTETIFTRNVYMVNYVVMTAAILALCRNKSIESPKERSTGVDTPANDPGADTNVFADRHHKIR